MRLVIIVLQAKMLNNSVEVVNISNILCKLPVIHVQKVGIVLKQIQLASSFVQLVPIDQIVQKPHFHVQLVLMVQERD